MKFGITLPNFGKTFGDIHKLVDVVKTQKLQDGTFLPLGSSPSIQKGRYYIC